MKKTYYPGLDETVFGETLPNGLTIRVITKPGFARKCAYFVTDFGSIHRKFTLDGTEYETPAGVAHYLEHKMFDLPGRDVSEEFAALGASANAFTSYDMTAYYFTCTDHFDESLRLLLEFVSTPYFTRETVDKERGIIAQEIRMYDDSPDSRVFEEMVKHLYERHPLREPISGSVESIAEITPELLDLCHRAFYHPANMILCVAGDVDPERVSAIARAVLPENPGPRGIANLGKPEEMVCSTPVCRMEMDVSMPTFQLGFKCPAGKTGEAFAHWEIVAELACEALMGESSELYLKLYEDGLIDSSFGWGFETIEGSAMVLVAGDSDQPEAVRDAVIAQAQRLAETGISQEEFQRMVRSFLGRRVMELDSFESTCFRVCAYHWEGFDYLRFPERFAAVEREEIQRFLKQTILAGCCCLSVVEPRPGKDE